MIYAADTWPTPYFGGGGQGVRAWENKGREVGEARVGKGRKWKFQEDRKQLLTH